MVYYTNWTKNPKNCITASKLLKRCLLKAKHDSACNIYKNIVIKCKPKNVKMIIAQRLPPYSVHL